MLQRPSHYQGMESHPVDGLGPPPPNPAFLTATGSQRDPPPRLSPPHCHGIPEGPPSPRLSLPHRSGISDKDKPPPQSQPSPSKWDIRQTPSPVSALPQAQPSPSQWDIRGTPSPTSALPITVGSHRDPFPRLRAPFPHRSTPWLPAYWWMACRNFLWCFRTLAWSIFFSSLVCL